MGASDEIEALREERVRTATDALQVWWAGIVEDPRFTHVARAVREARPLRGKIQPTPHAQHVADGYRQGYADALVTLAELPFIKISENTPPGGLELEQEQDPELNDGREDEASRRFS